MAPQTKIIPIVGALKNYAWGLAGRDSLAAALHASNAKVSVDPEEPAAELWLGTHTSGPSTTRDGGLLRETVGTDLPFLLKVLSVARPLSIQAHPDKTLAEKLHSERPDKYKDDNHKPEMAVALTPFEGMCNFREPTAIAASLQSLPSLSALVGEFPADADAEKMRSMFGALMRAPAADVEVAIQQAEAVVRERKASEEGDELFLRLCEHYPGDVGCFCAYLLNHVLAKPGEAFFMAANEPHAYLLGQCVEIMACSDNVVRAGLTPKFKDVDTLVNMLTYRAGRPDMVKARPDSDGFLYRPGPEEFQLMRYVLSPESSVELPPHIGNGIVFVVEGNATVSCGDISSEAPSGFAACLLDNTSATVTASEAGATVFRASVNQEKAVQ